MGWAGTALQLVGGIVQVGSSISAGKTAKKEAEYNASLAEQEAANIENQKRLTAYQTNRQINQAIGTTTAMTAGKGIGLSGSPMAIMLDTQTQMEIDKRIQVNNLETQKQQSLSQAEALRRKGKTAAISGYTNAFTSALNLGSNYAQRTGKL
ncbi:MAG: hypothetical protein WC332_01650 [Clostridia bacterium]|jgi:uncharacterized protein YjdB